MNSTDHDIDFFLRRFFYFSDGVIRDVNVRFRNSSRLSSLAVTLSTRDSESAGGADWVNVLLTISEVSEFVLSESIKESYQVLSNDLRIVPIREGLFFDFGNLPSDRLSKSTIFIR